MQKRYAVAVIVFFILSAMVSNAQDIHFSQFYASPLTLNPAMTGTMQGDYRITGIYRNQWANVLPPYVTYGGSFDTRILQSKLKSDVLGVGLGITNDRSGDGKLGDLAINANIAYHKRLGAKKRHYLGVGVQLGFVQRSLDAASLSFPSQHNATGFDVAAPNGENLRSNKVMYFDFNAGLLWNAQIIQRVGMFAGFSVFHLSMPKESFLGDNVQLAFRYVVHGGLRIELIKKLYLTPNYIFMFQNGNKEINFGTGLEYGLGEGNKQVILGVGGWYRTGDAGIVSATVEYMKVRLGLSYDITTSGLQALPNSQGSFEISLVYTGKFPGKGLGPIMVPCPRL